VPLHKPTLRILPQEWRHPESGTPEEDGTVVSYSVAFVEHGLRHVSVGGDDAYLWWAVTMTLDVGQYGVALRLQPLGGEVKHSSRCSRRGR
jgi:hypothetical protein